MAVKAPVATRAPQGTKSLVQAFFSSASDIPEIRRDAVIKAALTAIRDRLKDDAAKAKIAKAASKAPKTPANTARKPAGGRPAKATTPVKTPISSKAKRPRKSVAKRVASVEAAGTGE